MGQTPRQARESRCRKPARPGAGGGGGLTTAGPPLETPRVRPLSAGEGSPPAPGRAGAATVAVGVTVE